MTNIHRKANDNRQGAIMASIPRAMVVLKYHDGTTDEFKFFDPENAATFAKRAMKRKDVAETQVQCLT